MNKNESIYDNSENKDKLSEGNNNIDAKEGNS